MSHVLKDMFSRYKCTSSREYITALTKVLQECALFSLAKARFFEKAAFCGGTALRVLYSLDRFSEDLDFSLLHPDPNFQLQTYFKAIREGLASVDCDMEVMHVEKTFESPVHSAFLKGNSKQHLLLVQVPQAITKSLHPEGKVRIKFEVDTDPATIFDSEMKSLIYPLPTFVRAHTLPDLFAGKMHAILYRPWGKRTKGRDWYDLIWYLGKEIPVNLAHLRARIVQTQGGAACPDPLNLEQLKERLHARIGDLDIEAAKADMTGFVSDSRQVDVWSRLFFEQVIDRLKAC